jgi:Phosphopantetheine attachment site
MLCGLTAEALKACKKALHLLLHVLLPGAVELRNALTSRFGVELPTTATFDYPSIAALAGYVALHTGSPAAGAAITRLAEQDAEDVTTAADLESVRWAYGQQHILQDCPLLSVEGGRAAS